jgi:hypothetical protein
VGGLESEQRQIDPGEAIKPLAKRVRSLFCSPFAIDNPTTPLYSLTMNSSRSVDSVREVIGCSPKRSHAALPATGDPALRYTLTVIPATNLNWELKETVGEMPALAMDHVGPTRFAVTHARSRIGTLLDGAGMAGSNATYIEDPDGGFAYAGHTDKPRFHADKEQVVPLAPPVRNRTVIGIEPRSPIEGRETKSASAILSAGFRVLVCPFQFSCVAGEPGDGRSHPARSS